MMNTQALHPAFGVRVAGVDLNEIGDAEFARIRDLFDTHSLLLFPGQALSDASHIALAQRFGPIEDRNAEDLQAGDDFAVPQVSNLCADGSLTQEMDLHTLHLKANMLWHADSTFLPRPALANILTARVVTKTGGQTEFASSRAGWAAMPQALKDQIKDRVIRHRYAHSRARISPELAALEMFHQWPDQHWRAVWTNPATGQEALYIASHACGIDGMEEGAAQKLIDDLTSWVTQPQFVYAHHWTVGDVLIWDQRAVLHRATPWDYTQPRHLSSICVTATDADGVDAMRAMV